ncbi:glycoside hydrolase [Stereum hirsutum FP-91666 SS1]|uniref:glycoside hydrolase n=1 Tax=Stereum hirsutum (strain FP-91666) TaxID=721885 RepID=UPI00044106DF|nr:glycoside hydrolase [Stereum hirsutum FP-91666 SS1]EIM87592.1 glycoside hydrolase [Stereum hirsutum FP-91666 SS1]
MIPPILSCVCLLAIFPPFSQARPSSPTLRAPHLETRDVTNSSKAGLAWANGKWVDMKQYESTGKVSWYYTWGPDPVDGATIEFVPMFWGSKDIDDWQSSINSTISELDVKAILGFNEPQQSGQSNLTPSDGASLWQTYIEPLKSANPSLRLGSPAPSSAPSGKTWLQEWLSACNGGCTPDFIALHWYDVNATAFIEYLEDFHDTFGLDLWVTEWACQNFNDENAQCSQEDVEEFLNTTQSYMDSSSFVERYAWFGAMENLQGVNTDNALMDSKGDINDLGEQYIGGNATTHSSGAPPTFDPTLGMITWAMFTTVAVLSW